MRVHAAPQDAIGEEQAGAHVVALNQAGKGEVFEQFILDCFVSAEFSIGVGSHEHELPVREGAPALLAIGLENRILEHQLIGRGGLNVSLEPVARGEGAEKAEQVESAFESEGNGGRDALGLEKRVGVGEDEQFGVMYGEAALHALPDRVDLAGPIGRASGDGDDLEPRIVANEISDDFGGAVGAAIEGEDHAEARVVLSAETLHEPADHGFFVMCGNDDTDARPGLVAVATSLGDGDRVSGGWDEARGDEQVAQHYQPVRAERAGCDREKNDQDREKGDHLRLRGARGDRNANLAGSKDSLDAVNCCCMSRTDLDRSGPGDDFDGFVEVPILLLDRAGSRRVDEIALSRYGIPSIVLMENAARAVAQTAMDMLDDISGRGVVILCGPGNNGGDGFAAARHLHNMGADVGIVMSSPRDRHHGDAAINLEIAVRMGLTAVRADPAAPARAAGDLAARLGASLIIDALLGTGLDRPVGEPFAALIQWADERRKRGALVLAVDTPSGLDVDTGSPLGVAVRADTTVTFAGLKRGFTELAAQEYVGEVVVADIGVPRQLIEELGTPMPQADHLEPPGSPRHGDDEPQSRPGQFGH